MIRFEQVGFHYTADHAVLQGVSFAIKAGDCVLLTGPSGAGKSTLLKLLYLALRPTRGAVQMFGRELMAESHDGLPALRRHIGVVFQDFRLLPHLTVFENVALPLRIAGVREKYIRDYASDLLGWIGLGNSLDALPTTLSGGQQQRVAIARAVIHRPQVLLADEPTGNVDPEMSKRLLFLFQELNKQGTALIIASHDQDLLGRQTTQRWMLHETHLNVTFGQIGVAA